MLYLSFNLSLVESTSALAHVDPLKKSEGDSEWVTISARYSLVGKRRSGDRMIPVYRTGPRSLLSKPASRPVIQFEMNVPERRDELDASDNQNFPSCIELLKGYR